MAVPWGCCGDGSMQLSPALCPVRPGGDLSRCLCRCKAVATCKEEEAVHFPCSLPGASLTLQLARSRGTRVCPKSALEES